MNTLQKALKRKLDCFLISLCKDEDLKDKYNMAYIILRGKLTPRFLYIHEKSYMNSDIPQTKQSKVKYV